eukprot:2418494-Rhodomonas_salina.2
MARRSEGASGAPGSGWQMRIGSNVQPAVELGNSSCRSQAKARQPEAVTQAATMRSMCRCLMAVTRQRLREGEGEREESGERRQPSAPSTSPLLSSPLLTSPIASRHAHRDGLSPSLRLMFINEEGWAGGVGRALLRLGLVARLRVAAAHRALQPSIHAPRGLRQQARPSRRALDLQSTLHGRAMASQCPEQQVLRQCGEEGCATAQCAMQKRGK